MNRVIYRVAAELADEPTAQRYIAWLTGPDGHAAEVLSCGAVSATVCRLDADEARGGLIRVECTYVFGSRRNLDVYLRDHAPRLRAAGQAQFGAGGGVAMSRHVGDVFAVL